MGARGRHSLLAATAGFLLLQGVAPARAIAAPQGTAALTLGVAGTGENRAIWDKTVFHLGFRGDVLFGRSKNADFGIGPYADVGSFGFNDFQFGGGVSALLPIIDPLPLVLSLGGYGRASKDWGVEPGITGQVFWGSRSFNYHSSYVMSAGLLTELRYGLGTSRETAILIGAQVDLAAMSLPFIFLAEAISGGSKEAASIE